LQAIQRFFSPDRRENPPDFLSGDLEGWQEYGLLKKPKRFVPNKKNASPKRNVFKELITNVP
jgi:hypothetical protein